MSQFNSMRSGPGGGSGPGVGPGDQGADGQRRGRSRFPRFAIKRPEVQPTEPLDYKNIAYLAKFLTPQGKIQSRKRTGFSGQNQRLLAEAIKRARFMALLPYLGRP